MNSNVTTGQTAGVNIVGSNVSVGQNIAGRDITLPVAVPETLAPVAAAIAQSPVEHRAEAQAKLQELNDELQKGEGSDDSRIGRLVDGIVDLVPTAIGAIGKAFGTPVLSKLAGPVTTFVLGKISQL